MCRSVPRPSDALAPPVAAYKLTQPFSVLRCIRAHVSIDHGRGTGWFREPFLLHVLTARNVFSSVLPEMRFLTFVRTNADPFPGFTCKNSRILHGFPAWHGHRGREGRREGGKESRKDPRLTKSARATIPTRKHTEETSTPQQNLQRCVWEENIRQYAQRKCTKSR